MERKDNYLFSFGSAAKGKRGLFLKAFGSFPSGQLWGHNLHSQSTPRSPTLSWVKRYFFPDKYLLHTCWGSGAECVHGQAKMKTSVPCS